MIKHFIVLTFFVVAGMALGLAATSLLGAQRTPQAVPARAPDEREPLPPHLDEGSASDPIEIEASHRFVSILAAFRRSSAPVDTQTSADRGSQLAGVWNFNRDLSDDPRANPAPSAGGGQPGRRGGGGGFGGGFGGFGGRRGGSGGGGRGGFDPGRMEAMQEVLQSFMEAPKKLTIVERDGEIVVTDTDGRTQDLKPDGHKIQQKMANGLVSATRKTDWNGATLVTEIEIENGPTLVQTYARSEGGSQLVVTTKVNAARGGQPREIKYVYDPADSSLL